MSSVKHLYEKLFCHTCRIQCVNWIHLDGKTAPGVILIKEDYAANTDSALNGLSD